MKTVVCALTLAALLAACAPREVTRTEYIATPTFCQVTMPQKPSIQTSSSSFSNITTYDTFVSNLKSLLIYTAELEMALKCCTNSNDCIAK